MTPIFLFSYINYEANVSTRRAKQNLCIGHFSYILSQVLFVALIVWKSQTGQFHWGVYFVAHMTLAPVVSLGALSKDADFVIDWRKSQSVLVVIAVTLLVGFIFPMDGMYGFWQMSPILLMGISIFKIHSIWVNGTHWRLGVDDNGNELGIMEEEGPEHIDAF